MGMEWWIGDHKLLLSGRGMHYIGRRRSLSAEQLIINRGRGALKSGARS